MEITIYGSYFPQKEKDFLIRLKEALISEGYTSTRIVEDRPSNGLDEFQASKASLEFSDINFLVFTFGGKRLGVVRELAHCTSSITMTDRRWRCVLCYEVKGNRSALPPLSTKEVEKLHMSKIRQIQFSDETQLQKAMIGISWKYLNDLAEELRSRR